MKNELNDTTEVFKRESSYKGEFGGPWDTFDKVLGYVMNMLAGIGLLAFIAAIGYFTA